MSQDQDGDGDYDLDTTTCHKTMLVMEVRTWIPPHVTRPRWWWRLGLGYHHMSQEQDGDGG